MIKEYWINVYQGENEHGLVTWYGYGYTNLFGMMHNLISKPSYRIHVKMNGGYNRRIIDKEWIDNYRKHELQKREDTKSWLKNYSIDWQR